jgi:PBP1b-binding outer membrane lipoprotein LpoB
MRRLLIVAATVALLAGCTGTTQPPAADAPAGSSESEAVTPEERIDPEAIESMDEGIAWARALDDSVDAQEIAFETSNEIGQALMALDDEVRSAPETAGARVVDLKAVVDRLEAAIATGATP